MHATISFLRSVRCIPARFQPCSSYIVFGVTAQLYFENRPQYACCVSSVSVDRIQHITSSLVDVMMEISNKQALTLQNSLCVLTTECKKAVITWIGQSSSELRLEMRCSTRSQLVSQRSTDQLPRSGMRKFVHDDDPVDFVKWIQSGGNHGLDFRFECFGVETGFSR